MRGSNGFITEKTILFQGGVQHFLGGGESNIFQGGGGVRMLISIETHITCDFPGEGGGGVWTPIPHLDPHMAYKHCILSLMIHFRVTCTSFER